MKHLLIGAIALILTTGIVYGLVGLKYSQEMALADSQIEEISSNLIDAWSAPQPTPGPTLPSTKPVTKDTRLDAGFCLKCHDGTQISSFHTVERIKALDQALGRPVRICTTCHGSPVMPVHFKAIQRGAARCEACHIQGGGGFSVPLRRESDLLICQLCHAGGNYITIHIEGQILKDAPIDPEWIRARQGLDCTVCHNEEMYGGISILDLHEKSAGMTGTVNAQAMDLPTISPADSSTPFKQDVSARWESPSSPTTVVIAE